MPIKWYGTGDTKDPLYLHFSRIVNLTIHAMAYGAINSGLWFLQKLRHPWDHLNWFTEIWLILLIIHLVFVISRRPGQSNPESS